MHGPHGAVKLAGCQHRSTTKIWGLPDMVAGSVPSAQSVDITPAGNTAPNCTHLGGGGGGGGLGLGGGGGGGLHTVNGGRQIVHLVCSCGC